MEIRAVRESELEQVVELSCLAFNPDGHERYWQYVHGDRSYNLSQTRVVVVNQRVVSTLRVWERRMRVGASIITMGGIGGVCTHPNYRGVGYASALMEDTVGYLRTIGCDIGALFTIIPDGFYRRLGWAPFPLAGFQVAGPSLKCPVNTVWAVRNFSLQSDLDAVAGVYDAANVEQSGSVVRTRAYWDMQPSRIRGVLPTVVAYKNGRLGGYLNYQIDGDAAEVFEVVVHPDEPAVLDVLGSHLLQVCEEQNVAEIYGKFSHRHPFVARLAQESNGGVGECEDSSMMLYAVNLQVFLRRLLLEGQARLAASGQVFPELAMRFTVNNQAAVLHHDGNGTLQIYAEHPNALELGIPEAVFWKLLFGELSSEQVKADVSVRSDIWRFLSTLFPQRDVIFWPPDRY